MKPFCYSDGKTIMNDDEVVVADQRAVVANLIEKESPIARDYSCIETGGILLSFENGDVQLWPFVNEDLVLVRRGNSEL